MSLKIITSKVVYEDNIQSLCQTLQNVFSTYYKTPYQFVFEANGIRCGDGFINMNFKRTYHAHDWTCSMVEVYPPNYHKHIKLEGKGWKDADKYLIRTCLITIGISG